MSPTENVTVDDLPALGSPEFAADPLTVYARLRTHAPLARTRLDYGGFDQPVWVLSRYDDCRALLTDPRLRRAPVVASAAAADLPEHVRMLQTESLILKDGADHKRLRSLVAKAFTPRTIGLLGDRVRALALDRLDPLVDGDRVDLREQFALPVPVTVIAEMVGVGEADRDRFRRGADAMMGAAGADPVEMDRHLRGLVELTRELIERKRADPAEDLLTAMIAAEEGGDRLTSDELTAMTLTLVVAGYETTFNLIVNAVVTLLDHPESLARLRAADHDDPLWSTAVEEVLRFAGPVGGTSMAMAAEDVSWHGHTVPAGALVVPLIGAANRDPSTFADADRFDIARSPNPHLGFGHGPHFCLGANLARLEARIALQVLVERCAHIELAVPRESLELEAVPLWTRYRELPVRLS